MGYRQHWAAAKNVLVEQGTSAQIHADLGGEDEGTGEAVHVVLNDTGDMEAFVLVGTPQELFDLGDRIGAIAQALIDADADDGEDKGVCPIHGGTSCGPDCPDAKAFNESWDDGDEDDEDDEGDDEGDEREHSDGDGCAIYDSSSLVLNGDGEEVFVSSLSPGDSYKDPGFNDEDWLSVDDVATVGDEIHIYTEPSEDEA